MAATTSAWTGETAKSNPPITAARTRRATAHTAAVTPPLSRGVTTAPARYLSRAWVCRICAMPMPVKIVKTEIPDVLVVETGAVHDDRGFFSETFSSKMFEAAGFRETFLQD